MKEIAKYSPILEIGAGTGYWAYLLRKVGADIVAFDKDPPNTGRNKYPYNKMVWTEVLYGNCGKVSEYPNRTLFLCWPPYSNPMASNCLKRTKAKYVVYIGEGETGCTGDKRFFRSLEKDFEEINRIAIPQWYGIHDYLGVYKGK